MGDPLQTVRENIKIGKVELLSLRDALAHIKRVVTARLKKQLLEPIANDDSFEIEGPGRYGQGQEGRGRDIRGRGRHTYM